MKQAIFSLTVFVGLFPILCYGEPVKITLEWVELNRTQCPDLAIPFVSATVTESDHPKFADLKNSLHRRVLVKHVQQIEPGSKGDHATQIGKTNFDLSLAVSQPDAGSYDVAVEASLIEGFEDAFSLRRGNLPATPMQPIPVKHVSTNIKLSHGKSFALSGLSQRKNGSMIDQILIISLVEPLKTVSATGR